MDPPGRSDALRGRATPSTGPAPRDRRARLREGDVACWVLKTSTPPELLVPGWSRGRAQELRRCVRPSYRLDLMVPGQRCLLWLSGRAAPGVHAVGVLRTRPDAELAVHLRLVRLDTPVPRTLLVGADDFAGAEVVRMAAGSNPSYLTQAQLQPVVERLDPASTRAAGWA